MWLVVASQQIVYWDSTDRPVRILQVNADITERKAAEARLRETDQQFRQLAENISEVFWMSDPSKNQLLFVSPAYETLWGHTCQSLYESPFSWFEAVHPEDRDRVLQSSLTRQVDGSYDDNIASCGPMARSVGFEIEPFRCAVPPAKFNRWSAWPKTLPPPRRLKRNNCTGARRASVR